VTSGVMLNAREGLQSFLAWLTYLGRRHLNLLLALQSSQRNVDGRAYSD
jgi:hypothetical protein